MRKILIVDDNAAYLKVVAELLRKHDYQVLPCGTAEEGLATARQERCDVILIDLGLPGMDGFSLRRELLREEATREIPVVVVSGRSREEIEQKDRTLLAGSYGFIRKSYLEDEMVELLARVIAMTVSPARDLPHG